MIRSDIDLYKVGDLFIWAPFVSASKSEDQCIGGNALFEITTTTHFFGLNDKAYPRDISSKSVYPDEQEVLFPIACAYRVESVKIEPDATRIGLHTIDYN